MIAAILSWLNSYIGWVVPQNAGPLLDSVPVWMQTYWFYTLIILITIGIILLSAYGYFLYNRRFTRKRLDTQEKVIDKRLAHVSETAALVKEANAELAWTNDTLQDTNNSLHFANETLSWTNSQLSDANIALERRTAELRRALENNKEILGVTAHDLKNPLGGIIGLSDMLIEDLSTLNKGDVKDEVIENLGMIRHSAEGMLNTVTRLLDRHREGMPVKLNMEPADLNVITRIVVNWNTRQAINKDISLHFAPYSRSVKVSVDVSAMQRILDNLISNAIKFSPEGKQVWVKIVPMHREVVVSVQDEGPGLSDEDKQNVFGKMSKLSAKPTGGEHSSGLGLYIVKKLTEEQEGVVGVDSVQGEGATFWVKLPLLVHLEGTPQSVSGFTV